MTTVCAFCSAPLPTEFAQLALGAFPASAVQIEACAEHINALSQLWDAWIAWHWGMAERARGTAPPLPSSHWIPPPTEDSPQ